MFGAVSQTAGGDLSFGSLENHVAIFLTSYVDIASAMALAMSAKNSFEKREIWSELEGSSNILFGEGRKVLVKEVEGGEECVVL